LTVARLAPQEFRSICSHTPRKEKAEPVTQGLRTPSKSGVLKPRIRTFMLVMSIGPLFATGGMSPWLSNSAMYRRCSPALVAFDKFKRLAAQPATGIGTKSPRCRIGLHGDIHRLPLLDASREDIGIIYQSGCGAGDHQLKYFQLIIWRLMFVKKATIEDLKYTIMQFLVAHLLCFT
jgi:hypothetical protein